MKFKIKDLYNDKLKKKELKIGENFEKYYY